VAIVSSDEFSASTLDFNGSALYFSKRFQIVETETGQTVFALKNNPSGLPVFEQRQ
jgi:hypothetical protein